MRVDALNAGAVDREGPTAPFGYEEKPVTKYRQEEVSSGMPHRGLQRISAMTSGFMVASSAGEGGGSSCRSLAPRHAAARFPSFA